MADSYEVLLGKYNRALTSIKQLDQQNKLIEEQMEHNLDMDRMIEKKVRYLCTTILKKDRENKEKKNDMWSTLTLADLIDEAQKSLENYFPSIQTMIETLMKYNRERAEKIAALRLQIENAAVKPVEQVVFVSEEEKKTETSDAEIMKREESTPKPVKIEEVHLIEEPEDQIDVDLVKSLHTIYGSSDVMVEAKPGPIVELSNETKRIKNALFKTKLTYTQKEIEDTVEKLTDLEKKIIKVMGETGHCEWSVLEEEILTRINHEASDTKVRAVVRDLKQPRGQLECGNDSIVLMAKFSVPGSTNFCVYLLAPYGKVIYRYLYKKDPILSETERLLKDHGSLEHGYGIKKTAALLEEMECIKRKKSRIIYLTRTKEYSVKLGKRKSYIPDIIILTPNKEQETKMYIEYETGKCTEDALIEKCNKIASFCENIFIIVPNKEARGEVEAELANWYAEITSNKYAFPGKDKIRIRMSSYYDIENGKTKYGIPWEYDKTVKKTGEIL